MIQRRGALLPHLLQSLTLSICSVTPSSFSMNGRE